ncbi:MAG: hypothetical protein AABX53_01530 [Nanoarchaeota archaeon]
MTNFPAMPTAHLFFIPRWYDSDPALRMETAMAISDHVGSDYDKAYPLGPVFLHCPVPSVSLMLRLKKVTTSVVGNQSELEDLVRSMNLPPSSNRSFVYIADTYWCTRKADLSKRIAGEPKRFHVVAYESIPESLG